MTRPTDAEVETLARVWCAVRGFDPDAILPNGKVRWRYKARRMRELLTGEGNSVRPDEDRALARLHAAPGDGSREADAP